jgi:hypothetical protein
MNDSEVLALADALFAPERERRAIPPISAGRPELGPVTRFEQCSIKLGSVSIRFE